MIFLWDETSHPSNNTFTLRKTVMLAGRNVSSRKKIQTAKAGLISLIQNRKLMLK